jgi:hypothetical protein
MWEYTWNAACGMAEQTGRAPGTVQVGDNLEGVPAAEGMKHRARHVISRFRCEQKNRIFVGSIGRVTPRAGLVTTENFSAQQATVNGTVR